MIVLHPRQDASLPPEQLRADLMGRLSNHVTIPTLWTRGEPEPRAYIGRLREWDFQIHRWNRKNAAKPVITGRLIPGEGGLELHLTARIGYGAMVFLGFWFLIVGKMFYEILRDGLQGGQSMIMLAVPTVFFVAVAVFARILFRLDWDFEVQSLRQIFDAS